MALPTKDFLYSLQRQAAAQQMFNNGLTQQQAGLGQAQGLAGGGLSQAVAAGLAGQPFPTHSAPILSSIGTCGEEIENPPGKDSIRAELQSEVDEWLKDIP